MSQKFDKMVCAICGQENPSKHQDFCKYLSCSGRMIVKEVCRDSDPIKLANVRTCMREPKIEEVIISFNNDRHHSVEFKVGDSPGDVVAKLRKLADQIKYDVLLDGD